MSKDVALNPKLPSWIAEFTAKKVESFLKSAPLPSVPSISLMGREFTFITADGERITHPGRTLDVILIDGLPSVSRRYYSKGFDPSNPSTAIPTCWSTDGVKPDETVESPQARACASCPNNEKGSHRTGVGKACSTFRLLVAMSPEDPDHNLYRLSVSAMSLFAKGKVPTYMCLTEYSRFLEENKIHPSTVVTRLAFGPDSVPVIGFKAVDFIDEDMAKYLLSLNPADYAHLLRVGPAPVSERANSEVDDEAEAPEDPPVRTVVKKAQASEDPPVRTVARKKEVPADDTPSIFSKAPKATGPSPNKVNAASVKAPRHVVGDEEIDSILAELQE